jgi:broad specificity phosphatase PhoE
MSMYINWQVALVSLIYMAMSSRALYATAKSTQKTLWIIRHGQAMHNPRAEAAKEAGCTYEEFLDLMRQDDALDADLTEEGEKQGNRLGSMYTWDTLQLVVSSPLSRSLRTADLAVPIRHPKRLAVEDFREINGSFLNAKRRNVDELQIKFPDWDFGQLAQTDNLWTEELETQNECAERGYRGFCWLMRRPEEHILLVSHGGILRFTMDQHPRITISDERTIGDLTRPTSARFGNCELRKYQLTWDVVDNERRTIRLTEIDNTERGTIEL